MINLGKWFRKRAGEATPDDAEPSTGEMGVQAEEQHRADAAAVIEVGNVEVSQDERENGDPLGWHEFPEGKIREIVGVRGYDERGHEGYAIELPQMPTLFGEIRRVFLENKNDYNLEVISFGWPWKEMLGMPLPNRLFYRLSSGDARAARILISRFIALVRNYLDRPTYLTEYPQAHFQGKIYFREGWVALNDDGEP